MAKPIEATPVLKGKDLVDFVQTLTKKPSIESIHHRKSAQALLRKATKR
jgi:hypothetical protein